LYIPISILIGWIDSKSGSLPKERGVNSYSIKPIAEERITMPLHSRDGQNTRANSGETRARHGGDEGYEKEDRGFGFRLNSNN